MSALRSKIGPGPNKEKQVSVAKKTNIDQSRISRILKGDFSSANLSVRKLCAYVDYNPDMENKSVDPRECKVLMLALSRTWDGSSAHAMAIARVIDDIGLLEKGRTQCH